MNLSELKIKVCGLKEPENISRIVELGIDYAGFIFYPGSPRYVGDDFDPGIVQELTGKVKKVGVFVNEDVHKVIFNARRYDLDLIQLHGDEPATHCEQLQDLGYAVIKVFSVGEKVAQAGLDDYYDHVDFFLFDTRGEKYGGNGVAFDWEVIRDYSGERPFFLSGGLTLEKVRDVQNFEWPDLHAVDVNSRFEEKPGVKNVGLVRKLVKEIRENE